MSNSDLYISNGTCYSAAGDVLNDEFIPCGNSEFGVYTCCGKGDNCLADRACFGVYGSGYGSSLTYMAGCTDPDYASSACPKKFFGQEWEALTLCDNSDGAWAPCSQSGNPSTLQAGSYCSCTDASKTTTAFKDSTILASIAALPQSTGGTISFIDGHTPTTGPTATATGGASAGSSGGSAAASKTGSGGSSTGASGTQTGAGASVSATSSTTGTNGSVTPVTTGSNGSATPVPTNSSGSGNSSSGNGGGSSKLSKGAAIGIGVGVALGVLALLALLALLFLRRRRRRRAAAADPRPASVETANGSVPGSVNGAEKPPLKKAYTPPEPEIDGQALVQADGTAADPSNVRSELEGTNPYTAANLRNQAKASAAFVPPHDGAVELGQASPPIPPHDGAVEIGNTSPPILPPHAGPVEIGSTSPPVRPVHNDGAEMFAGVPTALQPGHR